MTGFKKYQRRDLALAVGRTAQADVPLEVGGIEEAVTASSD